jgi:hypothetical protein
MLLLLCPVAHVLIQLLYFKGDPLYLSALRGPRIRRVRNICCLV